MSIYLLEIGTEELPADLAESVISQLELNVKNDLNSSRIKFRIPDSGCNPYLTFASIINAGLKGMKENYKLVPETKTLKDSFIKH